METPPTLKPKELRALTEELQGIAMFDDVQRTAVSSGYQSMFEVGGAQGSGDVTRQYLSAMDELPPATYRAIDNNPYLAERAMSKLELDESLAARLGGTRQDVQNARAIIGEGTGFLGRLRDAVESGAVLPSIAAFAAGGAMLPEALQGNQPEGRQSIQDTLDQAARMPAYQKKGLSL